MAIKRNYDEYDCFIDPQKFSRARRDKNLSQDALAKQTGYKSSAAFCVLEKGTNRKRMNFGTAKKLAEIFGVSYTKFVALAPNQMSTLTKYCKGVPQTETVAKDSITAVVDDYGIVDEIHRGAMPEEKTEVSMTFNATPAAIIFKDVTGRELKYVLSNEEVA